MLTTRCLPVAILVVFLALCALVSAHDDASFLELEVAASTQPACYKWERTAQSAKKKLDRSGHVSWVDADGSKMHVYGGCKKAKMSSARLTECFSDVESLNLKSGKWSTSSLKDKNGVKIDLKFKNAAVAFDKASNAVFVFGGLRPSQTANAPEFSNSLELIFPTRGADGKPVKGAGFTSIHAEVSGTVPPPIVGARMVVLQQKLILVGGSTANGLNTDTYVMPIVGKKAMQWTKLDALAKAAMPIGRRGHSFVAIDKNSVLLFGGVSGKKSLNDAWVLSRTPYSAAEIAANKAASRNTSRKYRPWSWAKTDVGTVGMAAAPTPRAYHSAVRQGTKMFFFGGCDAQAKICYDELFVLDLGLMRWTATPASLSASGRPAHYAMRNKDIVDEEARSNSIRAATARRGASFTVLPGKRLVLAGGCSLASCQETEAATSVFFLNLDAACPNSCNGADNGAYVEENGSPYDKATEDAAYKAAFCRCTKSFHGKFCQHHYDCPNGCSKNGKCAIDKGVRFCHCKAGFWGADCALPACPSNCNGRGVCTAGANPLFANPADAADTKKVDAVKELMGMVVNHAQTAGLADGAYTYIPNDAPASRTSSGQSHCKCRTNYSGPDCSLVHSPGSKIRCPNDCSGHGLCNDAGKCECHAGFTGKDCTVQCPNMCSGNGTCKGDGICKCKKGFQGVLCAERVCVNNCSKNGTCSDKNVCQCFKGWGGRACALSTACSGHGDYVEDPKSLNPEGVCKCHPGWGNKDCSQQIFCPADCSGHGKCVTLPPASDETTLLRKATARANFLQSFLETFTQDDIPKGKKPTAAAKVSNIQGICKCDKGWTGDACQKQQCAHKCKNGFCNANGTCSCYPGHTGDDCGIAVDCKNNCTSVIHGTCASTNGLGKCKCRAGWHGVDCATPGCPKDCNGNGKCKNGHCYCAAGFSGTDCGQKCPNGCSKKGICVEGVCQCYPGHEGGDCSKPATCPKSATVHPDKECAGHGYCFRQRKKCICDPGYKGKDCSIDDGSCGKTSCNKRGTCRHGQCYCDLGFSGKHCEIVNKCPSNCNGRGFCLSGKCHCFTGFEGPACQRFTEDKTCPAGCSGNGVCQHGRCFCVEGYSGIDCKTRIGFCANNKCSGNGTCMFGKCYCQPGSSGVRCEKGGCKKCHPKNGKCMLGKCNCMPGFQGPDCSQELTCPGKNCSGNGVCILGSCACMPGYSGKDCSVTTVEVPKCPKNCSGRGVCHMGRCFCGKGYDGTDCSITKPQACPNNCSGVAPTFDQRGTCHFGKCFCKPGFSGQACETKLECPAKCEDNGICLYGKCFCVPGFAGVDCQKRVDGNNLGVAIMQVDMMGGIVRSMTPASLKKAASGGSFLEESTEDTLEMKEAQEAAHMELEAEEARVLADVATSDAASYKNMTDPIALDAIAKAKALTKAYKTIAAKAAQKATAAAKKIKKSRKDKGKTGCGGQTHGCSQHGLCVNQECICLPGYSGPDCSIVAGGNMMHRCGKNCNNQGTCLFGKCYCDLGFTGKHCGQVMPLPCPNDCNSNGLCHFGKCYCKPGFMSEDCSKLHVCRKNCGAHGICFRGQCVCAKGFTGDRCNLPSKSSVFHLRNVKRKAKHDKVSDLSLMRFKEDGDKVETDETMASLVESSSSSALPSSSNSKEHRHESVESVASGSAVAFSMDESNLLEALNTDDDKFTCGKGCGANGVCVDAKCFCEPGFAGAVCNEKIGSSFVQTGEHPAAPTLLGQTWKVSPVLLAVIAFCVGIMFSSLVKNVLDRRIQQKQTTLLSKPLVSLQASSIQPREASSSAALASPMLPRPL